MILYGAAGVWGGDSGGWSGYVSPHTIFPSRNCPPPAAITHGKEKIWVNFYQLELKQ